MKKLILGLLLVLILFLVSCGPPQTDINADNVLIGFDNTTISLDKGTTEFKEIADEAIKVYQHVGVTTECYFGPEEIEVIKRDNDFVEIRFNKAVEVPTSVNVNDLEEEIRDKHGRKTTEDGYMISELLSAIFPLTGEYKGHVLYRSQERYMTWYCFKSSRGFSKLENIANAIHSE